LLRRQPALHVVGPLRDVGLGVGEYLTSPSINSRSRFS
jgi:hypothetical protein